ncbi:hypothetical protein HAX54_027469 [Datura stramonium]|uniref:Putative plant transposon protein domain-containing protein n=1 Tax=Datura stramonium TaxID=4076 RepID=A0ABS8V4G1_DATST|nr:hypothetical protein [Datura stramonium]
MLQSGNAATISLEKETELTRGDGIKAKTPRFWKSVEWQVKRLRATQILDIEQQYKYYDLRWIEARDTYFPNMVRAFYANYAATLDNNGKKGQKASKLPILIKIQPLWLKNPREKLYKSSLAFTTKFWWAVVKLQLFSIGGDNILGEDRAVLVASLIWGFLLNIERIVTDEMRARATFSTSLPFPYLMNRLCKEAHMPLLTGINVEIVANKKHDFDKSKDETKHDLQVNDTVLEVFRPSGRTMRATTDHIYAFGAAIGAELAFIAYPLPTSTPSISDEAAATQGIEST